MRQWLGPVAKYLLYAAFAVCVFGHALALERETVRLKSQRRRIRAQIAHIRQQNSEREQVRNALDSDPFYVERVLRERYGYRRPGEEEPAKPERVPPQIIRRNDSAFALAPGRRAPRHARE